MSRTIAVLAAALLVVLALAGGIVARVWSQAAQPGGTVAIGGPFTLTAPDGHSVTARDFRGKWMLVYFGYTNCPDACPFALNNLANALDKLGPKRADIAPIFITVDPARDTPPVMGHYVALFDPQIVGLTGTQAQIDHVEHEYRVYASRHPSSGGGYTMDHSSIFYVMDKSGRFNSILDGAAKPADIAAAIEKLES